MTLRFIDSFDDRSTANAIFKWGAANGTNTIGTGGGRYAQGKTASTDSNQYIQYALDIAQDTWIIGWAMKSVGSFSGGTLWRFYDSSSAQVDVYLREDGRIDVRKGGVVLALSDPVILQQVWQYIEVKVKFNNTTGTVDFMVNSVSAGSFTGLDTTATANNYATALRLMGGQNVYIDDFYLCDGAGADTFRGDIRVETLLPNGAGASTAWTPSAGSNYQAVDDPYSSAPCPDGDSTYISSTVVGNRDSYAYSNLVITAGTIIGVQVSPNAYKTDAGARSLKSYTRIGGVNYDGSAKSLGGSYASYPELWVISPATAVAWTVAEVNGAEFGVKDEA